jgi:SAM-dependent methyltransferase
MNKLDQGCETYNDLYERGGAAGIYHQPYRQSCYYPMFKTTIAHAVAIGSERILEVGCGNGAFAEMLYDQHRMQYLGFDFSTKAIELARSRNHCDGQFFVGDALDPCSYQSEYGTIICTEVLEHVPDDLGVIANWQKGKKFVCSVPSFDSKYHVRFFESEESVRERYGKLLRIDDFSMVIHPKISGETLRTYFGRQYRRLSSLILGREIRKRWYVFSGIVY